MSEWRTKLNMQVKKERFKNARHYHDSETSRSLSLEEIEDVQLIWIRLGMFSCLSLEGSMRLNSRRTCAQNIEEFVTGNLTMK